MAVQAGTVSVSHPPGLKRREILITFFMLLVGGVILVLGAFGTQPGEQATFTDQRLGRLFSLSSQPTMYAIGVLCLFAAGLRLYRGLAALRRWLTLALAALAVFAFLVWMTSGTSLNLPGMAHATLVAATPLTLGAICGLLCERSGIINIAIEGMMLFGAFTGIAFAALFNNLWIGLIAACLTGGLMGALHAVLSIKYRVDQIVGGTVINILAVGATRFLKLRLLAPAGLNNPGHFDTIPIPLLSDIPIVGPILFNHQPTTYIMLILLVVINYVVFFTPWGLRMRACGEHPRAADTVGVHVNRMRYISVIIGGLIAGIGGAYFSLGQVGTFEDSMTRGQGFVALAAMIFGNWHPVGGFMAALLFGFADAIQVKMQIIEPLLPFIHVPLPPEFLQTAPYVLTIIVVAGLVGRVRPPAQEGKVYEKQ